MKNRIICAVLALLLAVVPLNAFATPPDPTAELTGVLNEDGTINENKLNVGAAMLVDARTGEVLYEYNADQQYFPASITKIMTCLLVLEYLDRVPTAMDATITIEKNYRLEDGASNIGVTIGEHFRFKDLLYGLMLASGNEIGIILGEYIAGDIDTFIGMMNEKAAELGMTNTHYNNPHGLNDPTHLTTARDQAILAVAAMKNETFRKIVKTPTYTCPATNKHSARTWSNHNKLLLGGTSDDGESYARATGIKTGYTSKAKCTLVSSARDDNTDEEYIAVILYGANTSARFKACRVLLEYGFTHFDQMNAALYLPLLPQRGIEVAGAAEGQTLNAHLLGEDFYLTGLPDEIEAMKNDPASYFTVVPSYKDLEAPVYAGDSVGTYQLFYGDRLLGEGTLIASNTVESPVQETPAPTGKKTDEATKAPTVVNKDDLKPNPTTDPQDLVPTPSSSRVWFWLVLIGLILVVLIALICIVLSRAVRSRKEEKESAAQEEMSTRGGSASRRVRRSSSRRRR